MSPNGGSGNRPPVCWRSRPPTARQTGQARLLAVGGGDLSQGKHALRRLLGDRSEPGICVRPVRGGMQYQPIRPGWPCAWSCRAGRCIWALDALSHERLHRACRPIIQASTSALRACLLLPTRHEEPQALDECRLVYSAVNEENIFISGSPQHPSADYPFFSFPSSRPRRRPPQPVAPSK